MGDSWLYLPDELCSFQRTWRLSPLPLLYRGGTILGNLRGGRSFRLRRDLRDGRLSLLHRVNPRPTATSPAGGRTTAIPSRSFAQIENKQDWTAIACVKIISSANTPTLRLWSIANGYENPGFDAASPGTVRTFVPMHPSWQGPTTRQPVLERILRDLPCGDQDRSCHGHLRVCGLRRSASAGALRLPLRKLSRPWTTAT